MFTTRRDTLTLGGALAALTFTASAQALVQPRRRRHIGILAR